MKYKLLILLALIASVLLSGCLDNTTPTQKEYQIVQITEDSSGYHVVYLNNYTASNETFINKINVNQKNDFIIYSNKTRLIDQCFDRLARCWVLYINKSDV